jgi:hypothetical protein
VGAVAAAPATALVSVRGATNASLRISAMRAECDRLWLCVHTRSHTPVCVRALMSVCVRARAC